MRCLTILFIVKIVLKIDLDCNLKEKRVISFFRPTTRMCLLLSMMTPHKNFPSDYLMSWSVVDNGMSSKLLTATGAPEVASGII